MTAADVREARRVQLGDQLSVVFEGGETLREVPAEAMAALRPDGSGVLAVLYRDVAQAGELARVSATSPGVERGLYLDVAGARVAGEPLTAADDDTEPAAAWAVWFPLTASQRSAWLEGAEIALGADRAGSPRVQLTPEQRRAIASDL